jgi:integrase
MAKPYYLSTKRHGGNFYVQFKLSDGSLSFQKSTGTTDRTEAEKIVMGWIVNGNIPARINSSVPSSSDITIEKMNVINALRTTSFSRTDIESIVEILKEKKYILTAVVATSPESKPLAPYLEEFWDFDKSEYSRERILKGHDIHKSYCTTMKSRVNIYWLPRLGDKCIGEVAKEDIEAIFSDKILDGLAPKTINSILASIIIPLKWAYYKKYTQNNCFDGVMKCAVKSRSRKILTMEQTVGVFKTNWENDAAKLANILAMYTGMRAGEIAGLRAEDIGDKVIYVRHSWSKYEGIKCCKNGEEREVPVAKKLRDALIMQASFNPYKEGVKGFVFFGKKAGQPTDPKQWNKYLHRALQNIGYSNPKEICFHSWRHFFVSRSCDLENDKRIVMAVSGHKTEAMLDHYAEHIEEEKAVTKMGKIAETLFLPVLNESLAE